jgi:hypothetical protein
VRVASSPDNDGTGRYCQTAWVRQARREGVREEPASERPSREDHQLESGGSGLGCNAHPLEGRRGTPWLVGCRWPGGHGECLRRSRGEVAGA